MNASKRGLLWLGGGMLLLVALFALAILGGGDDEAEGGSTIALAVFFWVGSIVGGVMSVRGVLWFMRRTGRTAAIWTAVATFGGIVVAVVAHNVIYAVTGAEEAFFFLFALLVGPIILVAAIIRAFRPAGHDGGEGAAPGGALPSS